MNMRIKLVGILRSPVFGLKESNPSLAAWIITQRCTTSAEKNNQ